MSGFTSDGATFYTTKWLSLLIASQKFYNRLLSFIITTSTCALFALLEYPVTLLVSSPTPVHTSWAKLLSHPYSKNAWNEAWNVFSRENEQKKKY